MPEKAEVKETPKTPVPSKPIPKDDFDYRHPHTLDNGKGGQQKEVGPDNPMSQ